jgi:hypothetical protein
MGQALLINPTGKLATVLEVEPAELLSAGDRSRAADKLRRARESLPKLPSQFPEDENVPIVI